MNFHHYFLEALSLKTAKNRQLTRNNSGAYKIEILDKVFKGKDRLVFPIKIDDIDDRKTSPLINSIYNKIKSTYDIMPISLDDYIKGIVYKRSDPDKKLPHKIGKLLFKMAKDFEGCGAEDLLVAFRDDPVRSIKKKNNLFVIFSRHPYDVAGMSTDRNWTSCMNLGGKGIVYGDDRGERENMAHVGTDILKGSIVAYLVTDDDRHDNGKLALRRPLSRILMKPCYNIYDKTDKAYTCGTVYGIENISFYAFVDKWVMENLNKNKENESYVLHKGLYNDGERGVGFKLVSRETPIEIAVQDILKKSKTPEKYSSAFLVASNGLDNHNTLTIEFVLPMVKGIDSISWDNRKPYTEMVHNIAKCSSINYQRLIRLEFNKRIKDSVFRLNYEFYSSSNDAEDDISVWEKMLRSQLELQDFDYEDTLNKLEKLVENAKGQHASEKEELTTMINNIFVEPEIAHSIEQLKQDTAKTKKVVEELISLSKRTRNNDIITDMYEFLDKNPDKEFIIRHYKNTFHGVKKAIYKTHSQNNQSYYVNFMTLSYAQIGEIYMNLVKEKFAFAKETVGAMAELHPTTLFSFAYFDKSQFKEFYKNHNRIDFSELQAWCYSVADSYENGRAVDPFGQSGLI